MTAQARRVARWVTMGLLGSGAVLLLAGWVMLATQPGLRIVWRFVEPRLPESVHVESVTGRLTGPLTVTGLLVEAEGASTRVATVRLDWDILPLLRRRLEVHSLAVEQLDVTLHARAADEAPAEAQGLPDVTLPVAIAVRRASVRDIEIAPVDTGGDPVVVDSVVVDGLTFADSLDLGRLLAGSPLGRIDASGWVKPQGDYRFELLTGLAFYSSDLGSVVGRVDVAGDLGSIRFDGEVSEPFRATASGTLADVLNAPAVDAIVALDTTELRALMADGPEGRVGGVVNVAGALDSLEASGSVALTSPATDYVEIEASLLVRTEHVRFRHLLVRAGEASVRAGGTVVLSEPGPEMDIDATWTAVRWPLRGEALAWSDSGSASLAGLVDDYTLGIDAALETPEVPQGRLSLSGRGSSERFDAEVLRLAALGGELAAHGRVGWAPEVQWDLELAARDVGSAGIIPDSVPWHGRISLDGRARGRLTAMLADVDVTVDTLHGVLNDARLEASTSGSLRLPLSEAGPGWAAARLSLRWLEAVWGSNTVFLSGDAGDSVNVRGTFSLTDLAVAAPTLGGSVEGFAHLSGARSELEAEVDVSAERLVMGSTAIDAASLTGLVETRPGGLVDVRMLTTGIAVGGRLVDSVRASVQGTSEAHQVVARLRSEPLGMEVQASGGISERRWSGTLDRLDIGESPLGSWRLGEATTAAAGTDRAMLGLACWVSGEARICLEGSWEAGGTTSGRFSVSGFPGSAVVELMPEGWALDGVLEADAVASLSENGAIAVEAQADLGTGRIRYPTSAGGRTLAYSGATFQGAMGADGARARVGSTLIDEAGRTVVSLLGDLALPEFDNLADTLRIMPLRGSVDAKVDDFTPFEFAMEGVTPTGGSLRVVVDVSGSVGQPELSGEANLTDGSAAVPQFGLELSEIDLMVRGRGLDGIEIEGALRSGTGVLTLSGEVPTSPSEARPARLRIRGTRVQAVALPEVEVWVSPDLEVVSSPGQLRVGGGLGVPVARIQLSEIPATAVRPSRDVVFVDDSADVERVAQRLTLSVRATLGDSVSFSGYGFSSQPTGSVLAVAEPGGTTLGTGEVTLNAGRYRAYGQDLTIERGRILFAGGPIQNPGLDIRATRTAQDGVVAGVGVGGTLNRPEVTLFSEPPMAESDALSYIVLGRPLGTASTSEGNRVANAARSLGLREGNVLANRIGQRFGLSEMRVEAEGPVEEAALIAGKYLSPRLYVSYGVGLFEPISTFRLRYLLSSRLTLRAESGRGTGADLLYRIERGR